jgi:hypothetical protein
MSRLSDDIRQCKEVEGGRRPSGDAIGCAMNASRTHVQQWHRLSEESVQNLRSLVGQLAAIPGRKAALMFSEGIIDDASMLAVYALVQNFGSSDLNWDPYKTKYRLLNRDVLRAMDEVRRAAREGGVSFFTLDTREGTSAGFGGNLEHSGLQPVFAQGVNPWTEMRETTARTLEVLARETGGRAYHGVDDLEHDLRAAADSFFGIYTVGYYRSAPDSKSGKIRVEVGRAGVQVEYRDRAEVRGERSRVARIDLEFGSPERRGEEGEQRLPVRLSIDFDELPLRKAGKSRGTVLGLHLQAIRPDGSLCAERLDIEVVALDVTQAAERRGTRYVHQTDLILPPGPYRIRARLSDDRQALVADRAVDLTLEQGEVLPGLR